MGFIRSFSATPKVMKKKVDLELAGKIYEHTSARTSPQLGKNLSYIDYFFDVLSDVHRNPMDRDTFNTDDFFVSIVWGDGDGLFVDYFSYRLDNPSTWKSNAGARNWVYQKGIWQRPTGDMEDTCEEGVIMLGQEAELRRLTGSLEEWLGNEINLDELNAKLKFRH